MASFAVLRLRILTSLILAGFVLPPCIAIAVALLAPQMAPIKRGSAEQLWEQACHFQPRQPVLGGHGNVYKPRDGWFVYDIQYMHHSDVYKVPEEEVVASLNKVVEKLRAEKENPDIYAYAHSGFEKWDHRPDPSRHNAEELLTDIREAQFDYWKNKNPAVCSMLDTGRWLIELRWAQGKWYWFNVVFEWLYLSGLVVFAAWPMRRDKGSWKSYAVHLGALPMLFMLPAYLGYATLSFSSRGPCGGVLYPWLLFGLRQTGSCNHLDREILSHIPQLLEPLSSEIPIPLMGNMNDIIWSSMPGPTAMALLGLVIALLVFLAHKLLDRLQPKSATAGERGV